MLCREFKELRAERRFLKRQWLTGGRLRCALLKSVQTELHCMTKQKSRPSGQLGGRGWGQNSIYGGLLTAAVNWQPQSAVVTSEKVVYASSAPQWLFISSLPEANKVVHFEKSDKYN